MIVISSLNINDINILLDLLSNYSFLFMVQLILRIRVTQETEIDVTIATLKGNIEEGCFFSGSIV